MQLAFDHAQRNNGVLPQNLQLLQPPTALMSPKQFSQLLVCPTTSKPFVYVGAGININTSPPNTILIYEPPTNHKDPKTSKGTMSVGYKDGSVMMVSQPFADKIIAELNAGHNPPRVAVTGFVR